MEEKTFDFVIVGAGASGALLAKKLSRAGKTVLLLEAGAGDGLQPETYHRYVEQYYETLARVPNAPYPSVEGDTHLNVAAPSPSVLDIHQIADKEADGAPPSARGGQPDTTEPYFVQKGPLPFSSNYTRVAGGTMMHWLGESIRMLPSDFKMKSRYGVGTDWPLTYDDLRPYYEEAEWEIGVSGDVADQIYPGVETGPYFGEGYQYPMHRVPISYLDQRLADGLEGMTFEDAGGPYPIHVVSTPQGRNARPRDGYRPVGAVGDPTKGQRCEGNSSCVPICPVQAKYNSLKTLDQVNKAHVEIRMQAVASRIEFDPDNGRVTGVVYKRYDDPKGTSYTTHTARGEVYIMASNPIETAKLGLASGLHDEGGQLGGNLMDHPYFITWGLMPYDVGAFRGPSNTSGIPSLRDGAFRGQHAAFRMTIGNWGWNYPAFAPNAQLEAMVDQQNLFGPALRRAVRATLSRQFNFGFLIEQTPQTSNAVTIDREYKDRLGNYRPVITYDLPPYVRAGIARAKAFSDLIFKRMGAAQYSQYLPTDAGYFEYEDQGYSYHGSGHVVGTHRMGTGPHDSVVDDLQRTWHHPNLYLVGCGSMPTIGTSNPTLTMAALALRTADHLLTL